ncbi:rad51 family DNA repair protein [Penicillium brasilianum]|uniref:Rad51 family DNA repair protein n=1 Tax=Penicillium brasilianum TaxID=104259 RepID=A0A1S9RGY5_PENBI|nr:rad51 family DNA repair protein [Penicillium brasilianum]
MAASLGATSLAEVHHQGLDQLLNELATVYPAGLDQQPPPLGVPVIDALLEVFMQRLPGTAMERERPVHNNEPPERMTTEDEEMILPRDAQDDPTATYGEVPAQVGPEPSSNVLFSSSAPRNKRPSPVVEISSSLSGAGKTQLLYYMAARAILPRTYGGVSIGGLDAAVVWMDADDRFDVYRLQNVATGILRRARESTDDETLDQDSGLFSDAQLTEILSSVLQHVHVFRPQSSSALLATLCTLDDYLYDLSRHHSASRPLHMLVIDSATAFFWQDKLRDEVARTQEIGRPRPEFDQKREMKQIFHLSDLYAQIVNELKRLQGQFGCAVVYTTTVSSGRPPASSTGGQSGPLGPYDRPPSQTPSLRPALPAPWGTFPVLRLVVHRDAVRPFPPAMSAHDARRDAPMRQRVVAQGKFSAWVNAWGREEWPRRVVDGVNWYNGGCFSFYVRADGVEIPLPDN